MSGGAGGVRFGGPFACTGGVCDGRPVDEFWGFDDFVLTRA